VIEPSDGDAALQFFDGRATWAIRRPLFDPLWSTSALVLVGSTSIAV
jgi:hypothetical protein